MAAPSLAALVATAMALPAAERDAALYNGIARALREKPPVDEVLQVIKTRGFDEVQRLLASDDGGSGAGGGSSSHAPAAAAAGAGAGAPAAAPPRRRWGISQHRHLTLYALGRYAVQAPPVPPLPAGVVSVLRWVDATLVASLRLTVLPVLAAAPRDEALLAAYAAAWQAHVLTGEWLRRVFSHADTVYIDTGDGGGGGDSGGGGGGAKAGGGGAGSCAVGKPAGGSSTPTNGAGSAAAQSLGPTLTTRAARLWRAVVFTPLQGDLVRAIVAATNAERDGAAVNRSVVRTCVEAFMVMAEVAAPRRLRLAHMAALDTLCRGVGSLELNRPPPTLDEIATAIGAAAAAADDNASQAAGDDGDAVPPQMLRPATFALLLSIGLARASAGAGGAPSPQPSSSPKGGKCPFTFGAPQQPLVDLSSTPADAPSPYATTLEPALLAATKAYYTAASAAWLTQLSGSAYVARVEATFAAEDERLSGCALHPSTGGALTALLTTALIADHAGALVEKEDGTGLGAVLAAGFAAGSSATGAGSAAAGAGAGAASGSAAAAGAASNPHLPAVATFYRLLRRLGAPGCDRFAAAVRRHVTETGAALAAQREARYAKMRNDALARASGGGVTAAATEGAGAGAGSSSSSAAAAATAVVRKRLRNVPLDADDPVFVTGLIDLVGWADAVEVHAAERDARVSRAKCAALADIVQRRLFADGPAQEAECPSTVQSLVAYIDCVMQGRTSRRPVAGFGAGGSDEKLSGEALDVSWRRALAVLPHVADKDVFGDEYRTALMRRLLGGKSESNDSERALVSALKAQQGVTFVSKIERMLADYDTQDVALAGPLADLNLALDAPPASALAATRPSRLRRLHSFEPMVLTDGSWPKSGVPFLHPPRLPPDLDWYRSTFETAYTVNTKKKLKWLWDAGRMEVNYRPLPPPPPAEGASSSSAAPAAAAGGRGGAADVRTLQCGTLAGLVLAWLAEAPGEEYPLAQAVADLGLSEEHTIRVVATLTIGVGVLTYKGAPPPPPGARPRKPKPDDVLVVAPGFRPAKHVIRVPAPTPPLDAATGSETTVEDRKFAIQATLVRVMKARRRLGLAELTAEVMAQLGSRSFRPDPKSIKLGVEELIAGDYLERDADDPSTLLYMA